MSKLQVLVVEDSQDDTELLMMKLAHGGHEVVYERVETAEAMQAALARQAWDIVISDYRMPHFNGFEALKLVREGDFDMPFLMISGVIGEEEAVAAMRAGAQDYLIKEHLARLVPVVERELREAQTRREKQQAEAELKRLQRERERHSLEQITHEVSRLNERLSAIFKTVRDIIILMASDGRIEIANPALTRKFGYLPEEIVNQPLSQLIIPSQKDSLDRWVREVITDRKSQRQQVIAISKEGDTFDMEISLARVHDNDNHVVVTLHDISHFKTVARMKDNFISMVSHELRSPVTSLTLIAGALQTFYERYTESQVRQKLAQLNNQCQMLMDLIESVLDISRLEAQNGQSLKAVPVDMTATLKSIVTELQADVISKRQTLATFYDDQPTMLRGDQLDFARIWRNLISNAVKYTAEGGQISVRLECLTTQDIAQSRLRQKEALPDYLEDGRSYIIGQVEDNGHGIDPADLPTLFQRFNRGWAQTSNIPGTGLGLALVRELLTLYQGDIHVSSQLGEGSTFTFWLPG